MHSHILYDCEALVLKIQEPGSSLLENQVTAYIYISKVLHFDQSAGQLDASAKVCTKDQKWLRSMGHRGTYPNVFYSLKCVHTMEPN